MSEDYGSYQFKVGVGHGGSSHLRVRMDPDGLFPDGVVGTFVRRQGRLCVELLNRRSGKRWQKHSSQPGIWQTTISSLENRTACGVEPFGSVHPSEIEKITGGLLLTLPELLNPPHARGKFRSSPNISEFDPPVELPEAELSSPETSQPAEQKAVTQYEPLPTLGEILSPAVSPLVSLPEAVQAVNQWKELMGPRLQLRLDSETGTLRALAEYGL